MRSFRRTRLHFILSVLFALSCLGLSILGALKVRSLLYDENSFTLRMVEVDGALEHLTVRELADITGRMCGGRNLVTLNVAPLLEELMSLPWVSKVKAVKRLPHTLILSVVEHVPAAYWNDNGLFDAATRSVFYPKTLPRLPLVRLSSPADDEAAALYDAAAMCLKILQGTPLTMVEARLDQAHGMSLTLKEGTVLILGRLSAQAGSRKAIADRLERFARSFKQLGSNLNQIEYADLRYDSGFAVKFRSQEKSNRGE